ncbi:MAG: hypothetical protein Q8K00_00350 [Syntrophales bacterium]|nr:hypothetical protein [Syntrophales bacterium]
MSLELSQQDETISEDSWVSGLSYRRYDNLAGPASESSFKKVKEYLMVGFLLCFAHLRELNYEVQVSKERIVENAVKLLEGV